jgi:acylglycerol lipase
MPACRTFRFQGLESLGIFCRSLHPRGDPRAVLVLVHGYAEHSGRYLHLADYLVNRGYAIYTLDNRGHGQSDGVRADVVRFENYLSDIKTLMRIIKQRKPERPIILIGHSLGGAIATLFAARCGPTLDGLITSGVGIVVLCSWSPVFIKLAKILEKCVPPRLPVIPVPIKRFSRDPQVVSQYRDDPLNYTDRMRVRMGVQILRGSELVTLEAPKPRLPVLFLHGAADSVANPRASRMLHERVSSRDKILRFYEGLHYEIFNEPGQQQVFDDMAGWLGFHTRR